MIKQYDKPLLYPNGQRGVALVISLIFLLVATLLALSTLSGNVSEEKMTRNTLQRQIAFEAAEIALLAGEAYAEDDTNSVDEVVFHGSGGYDGNIAVDNIGDQCTNGLCTSVRRDLAFNVNSPQPERWLDTTLDVWNNTSRHIKVDSYVQTDLGLPQRPKFIVEFLRYIPAWDNTNNKPSRTACDTTNYGTKDPSETEWRDWPYCPNDMKEFRITAVGYAGNNSEVQVMLQSIYIAD